MIAKFNDITRGIRWFAFLCDFVEYIVSPQTKLGSNSSNPSWGAVGVTFMAMSITYNHGIKTPITLDINGYKPL